MDTVPIEMEALERVFRDPNAEPIKVSYGLLRSVTDNFSSEIGHGGFGVVFLGYLGNEKIAVKKLSNAHCFSYKQFLDEIKCLIRAKHNNIVRFLGYCSDTQGEVAQFNGAYVVAEVPERLLVFEYVPNGNIQHYLEEKPSGDDWHIRYKMIHGICQGLRYLHEERIGHFDLKPENVMLDSHMEPKIADFGLSRFLDVGNTVIITANISGTMGYIAPETIARRELSFMSDIYALGIIVIKLLTGPANIDFDDWHESLVGDFPQMKTCIDIARACVEIEKSKRPTIGKIIRMLNDIGNTESSTNQLVTAPVFAGTELLDVYPLELRLLFKPDKKYLSGSLTMINKTDGFVYCLVVSRENEFQPYFLPPESSSVNEVRMDPEVECEILMFTTLFDNEEVMADQMHSHFSELYPPAFQRPLEDVGKVVQEFFGGELHRAALTASVIVGPEVLQLHTIDKKRPYFTIDWMDVHPTTPWVLMVEDGTMCIWNWQTNEKVGEYNSPNGLGKGYPYCNENSKAKFIAREQWAVVADNNGYITVLTCPTMDQVQNFKAHQNPISVLAVHSTRPFLLSYSSPKLLKLWDWSRDWSLTATFAVRSPLRQVKFNPHDTTTFATRGLDGVVEMWTIGRLTPIATTHIQDLHKGSTHFTYTGYRNFAAVIDDNHTISIWDLQKQKHVYTLRNTSYGYGHDYVLVICHPTRPILVTASTSGPIEVWDSTTYRLKKTYYNVPHGPIPVGFTGTRRLVMGHTDGISVLDIDLE